VPPVKCTVCSHPDCEAINAALVGGVLTRHAAGIKYGIPYGSMLAHAKNHIRIPGQGETDSFRELRELKQRVDKALDRIETGVADDIERKQQASLLREQRTLTEKLGALSGEINSKTVTALLHRLGVPNEKALLEIIEERRKMADITVEELVQDCCKGLLDAFQMDTAFRAVVRDRLFPVVDTPEMEE
jgi:hypothetical protein